uniref:Vacuolar protein sorting-associated protein 45 n=1 Tax=Panagrellus redivivus TaxID=6233 RepID=A0A7E4W499_PANRE
MFGKVRPTSRESCETIFRCFDGCCSICDVVIVPAAFSLPTEDIVMVNMDILVTTQQYIHEMTRLAGPGMKVMLMDKETTPIVSCAFAQSEMMSREVFLFERIDTGAEREVLKILKCIVFVRPTPENVQLIVEELRAPKYAQYYLYFSNTISKSDVKAMAEADEFESVREVHEFFADNIPLAPQMAVVPLLKCYETPFSLSVATFRRCSQALLSLALSFKKRPVIRFQKSSRDAQRLADEFVKSTIREDKLFESGKTDTVFVILDRCEDPVSPLLNQWTYEAMVHELIGMTNNRVSMPNAPEDGLKNIVLSAAHDDFYAKNRYSNFGEIGQNIRTLMNDYQRKAQTHQKLESIADMKRFVDQYPQFKKITGTVSKHVQLVGELSRLVGEQNLLEISELEQNLVAGGDHSQCFEKIKQLLKHEKTTNLNALRLVMLYALRFEGSSSGNSGLAMLKESLKERNIPPRQIEAVDTLLKYAGSRRRQSDLFGNKSMSEMTKRFMKGLKGVENVYTQHEPYVMQLVNDLYRGKLSEVIFGASEPTVFNTRYDNIIFFVIGGTTFEESACIANFNERRATNPSQPRVLLAGTGMHNSRTFIEQLIQLSPDHPSIGSFASLA